MTGLKNNIFFQYFVKTSCVLLVCYIIGFMVWTIFYTETGNGDNVEHIHSTWLVHNGKIPYKDFFQHHNPLLWYIFAPFIGYIINPVILLDVAHALGMLVGFITFVYVYKISATFFANKISSILSLLVLCPPYFYIYCFNYNPDTFMALCYAIGIYYLFLYLKKNKLIHLVISFFMFFVSFLFTQKILFVLFVLGLLSLFVFYKKQTPLSDIGYALLLPITGLALFVAYLYNKSILGLYWQTNYLFNIEMQEYYGFYKINIVDKQTIIPAIVLATISVIFLFLRSNIYYKIFSILFVAELLQRFFYFSIAPYYLLPLMIYTVCLNSVVIEKITNKYSVFCLLCIAISCFYVFISKDNYLQARGKNRDFAHYIAANITPCDYVLSSFLGSQSIISKDPHYYWALLGHIDIAGEKMGIYPKPNVSEIVLKYKPKFIYGGMYFDNYAKNRGYTVPVQKVDDEILEQYYIPTPFSDFYLLKYEYHQKKCHYDVRKKEWMYAN
jgi:hypothetical protein